MDGHFAIGNAYMHVKTKNEIRPSEQLHVFNDLLVTFAFGYVLIAPVRKRMCSYRLYLESCLGSEFGQSAAQFDDVRARMFDGVANLSAQLNDRLVHLGFDLLF